MTTGWNELVGCSVCGAQVSTEQPVKAWIRGHRGLDSRRHCLCIGDSDLWIQRYGTRRHHTGVDRGVMYLMLVEIKTHGAEVDDPQRDLLHIVNQLLRTNSWKEQRDSGRLVAGHAQNVRPVSVYSHMARSWIRLLCYGVHTLRMSGATPAESRWIKWDRHDIDHEQLVGLLRFDLSPDSLRPMEHRSHKRKIEMPTLPGLADVIRGNGGAA